MKDLPEIQWPKTALANISAELPEWGLGRSRLEIVNLYNQRICVDESRRGAFENRYFHSVGI
jgi:hypothetical protein